MLDELLEIKNEKYYLKKFKRKIIDFFIGVGISFIIIMFLQIFIDFISMEDLFSEKTNYLILVIIGLIICFFILERKWIGIGILITLIVLPISLLLLLFGACLVGM